jgi:HD-like signal output (HDOD) protein/ActR/RegA family two-component response regulator
VRIQRGPRAERFVKRILFVDDDPRILHGLEVGLHHQREHWQMTFAEGAAAGLEAMRAQPQDVVVTDMRMPGMDGAALLSAVMGAYPRVARVAFSAYADRRSIVRALGVAHQFVAKPCQPDVMVKVVERMYALQWMVWDPRVREFLSRLTGVPPLSELRPRLADLVAPPEASLAELRRVVERDIPLAAKVLQVANAHLPSGRFVSDLGQALEVLGVESGRGMLLSSRLVQTAEQAAPIEGLSFRSRYERSLLVARIARRLLESRGQGETAYAAALLADLGSVVLGLCWPDEYADVIRQSGPIPTTHHERLAFGFTHADAGAYLLGMWGLPSAIVQAVAHHHRPFDLPAGERSVASAIEVAETLATETLSPGAAGEGEALTLEGLRARGVPLGVDEARRVAETEAWMLESATR